MKNKRVTCFISSLASGGAERQLAILANLLSEKGYEVSFVTCLNDPDFYSLNPKIKRIYINSGDSNLISGIKMIKYFRSVKTDVIISFRERMNLVTILGCLGRKIKIIAGERNLTTGKPTLVGSLNERFLYRFADYIVANSISQEHYLKGLNKIWRKRVRSIINYTDIEPYKKITEPVDDSILKIGVFARFAPQKNCLRFIEVVSLLKALKLRQFEIHWYGQRHGKINNSYYSQVIEHINKYNVSDVLILHDAVTDVAKEMSNYHALALPSLFEGFSNSIAEGICGGKPMLVSDVSDNSLMVHNGVNGYLFNPNDTNDMLNRFTDFLKLSKEDRSEMAAQSRNIAKDLFDAEKYVNSYINLIEN